MQPDVRTVTIEYTVSGHSLRHDPAKRFGHEILALLGRVWPVIKANAIPNDGINRVVYDKDGDGGCTVFAGVVLGEGLQAPREFEQREVRLTRYAYWKHIGPYHLIPVTGDAMTAALKARGVRTGWPMVEVYGHWSSDESKLETETFVAVE